MKTLLTIICLLFITTGFSQTILYGQEMSGVYTDMQGDYSIVEIEYDIKDSDIRGGDKVYHNKLVTLDEYGYPYDYNYVVVKKEPHVYEVINIH